ncbi:autotransporter-associated beta strand repeat-containing protein [Prosthecobacter debontii]|nr:autotransporter-associated beta strand repeat-containing protein [Prosthecobacter debontii]
MNPPSSESGLLRTHSHLLPRNRHWHRFFPCFVATAVSLLLGSGSATAQVTGDWNSNSSANWSDTSRWVDGTVPNGVGHIADVVHNISSTRTITLDVPVTLGVLRLGDTNASHAFYLQGETLTFDNGGAGAILDHGIGSLTGGPSQNPSSSDRLTMKVILNEDLKIFAERNIQFYDSWDAQGNDITIEGTSRVYFVGTNGTSSNGRLNNAGTVNIISGELRFDGQQGGVENYVDAQTIELGTGSPGPGMRAFTRFYLVNTEATQDFDLNMNGYSWFINDLGNNDQTFTGNITLTGDFSTNIIDLNDPGSQEQHHFTGVISGTGGLTRLNTGAMILHNDNTYLGETHIERGRSTNLGSIQLTDANGRLSGTTAVVIDRDGSFYLDNSAAVNNDRVNDAADLEMGSLSRFRIIGNSSSAVSETMANLVFKEGTGRINFDLAEGSPQTTTLNFSTFQRTSGSVAQIQVLDNLPGSLGTTAQLHIADAGASTQQIGAGGSNGTTTRTLVLGAYGGVNDISNHFMTFDSDNPTLLRPLDFDTEYLLSQNLVENGVAHTLNRNTIDGTGHNVMINYNVQRAVDPDPQVDWYDVRPIRVTESIAINSLRFGTNTPTNGLNTNELGSTLVLDPNAVIYLGDKAAGDGLPAISTTGSGMLLFGRDADGTSPGSNQYIIGGAMDFGSREAIIVNESGNSALLRTEIRGTGGLTKGGAQAIYLDNANTYTGLTTIAEGTMVIRHDQALGGSHQVTAVGNGALYMEHGLSISSDTDLLITNRGVSGTVLRSNSGHNTWNGDIIVDNVSELGQLIYTPYVNVATGDTLSLNGTIYGADLNHTLAEDVNLSDARIISTESSSAGIININGVFQDTMNGPSSVPVADTNENHLLRFQVTGNDQLVVNVRQQWNAAGRILVEQGLLRYEGEGNFWTDEAAAVISPTNGQSGMRFSGSSSGNVANIHLVLTKDGQKLNIDRVDIGGNGGSDNYNDLGNIVLAGSHSSGTVTFGNGASVISYGASDSTRSHTRDLAVFALGEGIVNVDFRLDDTDGDVHTSFTKIGSGIVNLRGDNSSSNGDVEQVNLAGGLLRLTNYGSSTGTRFDNGAMLTFSGGSLEMDGVGSTSDKTENFTGTAVGGATTFPTGSAKTIVGAGSSNVIVTSDVGRTTTLNIGSADVALDRQSGGTLNFVENNQGGTSVITFTGSGGPAADTAIAWATYGDSFDSSTRSINALDFAMVDSAGNVSAFDSANRENVDDAGSWNAGTDVSEGAAGFSGTTTAGANINTLHFDHDGSSTLTIDASGLTIESGGLMVSSAVATTGSTKTLTGGSLRAGAGQDLIIHHYGADTLTVASDIVDNSGTALVKTGRGELVLSGSNSYTGATHLNGGTVTIDSDDRLGVAPTSTQEAHLRFNGGTLRATADLTLDANRGIMIGGNGGGISVDDGATLSYGGILTSEPNPTAGYATPLATGALIKTGTGTLSLTGTVNNTFTGQLDVREGTLRWDGQGLGDVTLHIFGTSNAFLDGTIIRSGATLDLAGGTFATNSNDNAIIEEWFTFEAGSTLSTSLISDSTTPRDRNYYLRGVVHLDALGQAGTIEGAITMNVARRGIYFNDDGGYITGDGSIQKVGAGALYFRDSSPEWTGQLIINEGTAQAYSAGDVFGTGTLPILLGHDGSSLGETPGGNSTAGIYIRNETGFQTIPSIEHDIIVRNENGLGSQVKRLGGAYLTHENVAAFNGNLILNDDVEFYYQDDARDSTITDNSSQVRNDTRNYGAPENSETVFINFNGDISGTGEIKTNISQGGNGNTINGSISGEMDDLVIYTIFGLNGDNTDWTGDLIISNNGTGGGVDDVDRQAFVRLGNTLALNDNTVRFGNRGHLQLAGLDKTFTQNFLFIGGTGNAPTAKIQNASETDITITFHADETRIESLFQDVGVGLDEGVGYGSTLARQGLLNVVKTGAGHTVFGASTGGNDIIDSFSSYRGTTTIQGGILYAGSNNSLSPNSRFIVEDGAALSIYWDEAGTGFETTIGSLEGGSGALVNIDSSILSVGGDGTTDADFAGTILGVGTLVKVGTGTQRLSGDNTFDSFEVAIVNGSLVGGTNTAFGLSGNQISTGGSFSTINRLDARVELLLDGSADAVENFVWMNPDSAYEGVTIIGTRATSGTYGFADTSALEANNSFFTRSDGTSTFRFGGKIDDLEWGSSVTKIGSGTVELYASNVYGFEAFSGQAIDGGTIIREGLLSVFNEGALASTVVELGDTRRVLDENVFLATSSGLVTRIQGAFEADSDGLGGSGNGAFVGVSTDVDGVTLTSSDIGKRILVKDEHGNPERNGIYEIVSIDSDRNTMTLVRAGDFDEETEMLYGTSVTVEGGSHAGDSFFMISQDISTVNGEETDPVYWEQETQNANLGLMAGEADLTIFNDIDINDTNGQGITSIGGLFTTGNSIFAGNITLQHQDDTDNIREVTLTSASNTDSGSGERGIIFTGILSEAEFGDTLHVRIEGGGSVTLTSDGHSYTGKTTVGTDSTLVLHGNAAISSSNWIETENGAIFDTTQLSSGGSYITEAVISGTGTFQTGSGQSLIVEGNGIVRPGLSSSPYLVSTAGDQIGTIIINGDLDLTAGGDVDRIFLQMGSGGGADYNDADNMVANMGSGSGVFNSWLASQGDIYDAYTGGNHDRLTITGNLALDAGGYIHFDNGGGYTPQFGDVFNLLDWTSLTQNDFEEGSLQRSGGMIGDLYLPDLAAGWFYNMSLFASHGIVVVVPEPSRALLLIFSLVLLLQRRRRSAMQTPRY